MVRDIEERELHVSATFYDFIEALVSVGGCCCGCLFVLLAKRTSADEWAATVTPTAFAGQFVRGAF